MTKEHLAKSIKNFNHNKLIKRKTKKIFGYTSKDLDIAYIPYIIFPKNYNFLEKYI